MKFFKETSLYDYNKSNLGYIVIDDLFDPEHIRNCSKDFLSIPDEKFVKYQNEFFEFVKYLYVKTIKK